MTLAIPLNHMQVAFHHSIPDAEGEAIVTLGVDLTATAGSAQAELDVIVGLYQTLHTTRGASSVVLTKTTGLYHAAGGMQTVEHLSTTGGVISGALLPANCAVLVQKLSGYSGKHNRGRLYVPGIPVGVLVSGGGNLITSSVAGAYQAAFDTFWTGLAAAAIIPVIFHQTGFADPPRAITSFKVLERLATQRGRMRN